MSSTGSQEIALVKQGPGPATVNAEWSRVIMIHEGLMPLSDLKVGDTFVPLSSDDGYKEFDVLQPAAALKLVRDVAPDAILEWGSMVRARDIHPATVQSNGVCRAVWSNGLAVIVGIDLALRTATIVVRRDRKHTMKTKRFPPYQAMPEVTESWVG